MWANPWGGGGPIQQSAFQGMPNDQGKFNILLSILVLSSTRRGLIKEIAIRVGHLNHMIINVN